MTPAQQARVALGRELRALRLAKGLHQEDLADALGWQQSKISRIEAGKNAVPPEHIAVMLAAIGGSPTRQRELLALARLSASRRGIR